MNKKLLPLFLLLPLLGSCMPSPLERQQMLWKLERDARLGYPDSREYRECNYEAMKAMGGYQPGPYAEAMDRAWDDRKAMIRQCMELKEVKTP